MGNPVYKIGDGIVFAVLLLYTVFIVLLVGHVLIDIAWYSYKGVHIVVLEGVDVSRLAIFVTITAIGIVIFAKLLNRILYKKEE